VQEALARAFYALPMAPEIPALRPWLFRIAHNAAMDHLKRHEHKYTEARDDLDELIGVDETPDPYVVRAALARFVVLPVTQRCAVILKDVLGHSLEEAADTMGTTVMAVKAALVRGRRALRQDDDDSAQVDAPSRALLDRYAHLFNAKDWDGVRALVGSDCRLDLVSKSQRRGKEVGMYFGRYEKEDVRLTVVRLDGAFALAAHVGDAARAAYFILLDWRDGQVQQIRDFRYVPYIAVRDRARLTRRSPRATASFRPRRSSLGHDPRAPMPPVHGDPDRLSLDSGRHRLRHGARTFEASGLSRRPDVAAPRLGESRQSRPRQCRREVSRRAH
jgi:RNA polymerase sigma-70 factor (ECF subfamily)